MDESDARLAYVIGRRMRRIRRDQELSQEAVAWVAGIHRTQISLYEHGERMPFLSSFVRVAGGLGVSPCMLLDGITWAGGESKLGGFVIPDQGGVAMAGERSSAVAERFGANLRRVRRREGLSQEELAVRASLHRTEIGRLEVGERACRIDTLIRLAGAMAVPPGELLDGIAWVPAPEPQGAYAFGSSSIKRKLISEWPSR